MPRSQVIAALGDLGSPLAERLASNGDHGQAARGCQGKGFLVMDGHGNWLLTSVGRAFCMREF